MKRIKEFFKTLIDIIMLPEMIHLPGNLAFFIILSIFPILILIGILSSYFSVSIDGVVNTLSIALPKGVEQLLLPYIHVGTFSRNIIVSTVFAFILASNGTHALILASNSLYDIKNSSYIKRRIKALFLILLLIVLFIFMISFLTYGNRIFTYILESVSYEPVNEVLYYLFAFIKWPIAMFIIYLAIKLLYVLSPDGKIYSATTSKGALFSIGFVPVNTYADPGFYGRMGIVMNNASNNYLKIPCGEEISKVEFVKLKFPVSKPYHGQHGFETGVWPLRTDLIIQKNDIKAYFPKENDIDEIRASYGDSVASIMHRVLITERRFVIATVILIIVNLIIIGLSLGTSWLGPVTNVICGIVANLLYAIVSLVIYNKRSKKKSGQ